MELEEKDLMPLSIYLHSSSTSEDSQDDDDQSALGHSSPSDTSFSESCLEHNMNGPRSSEFFTELKLFLSSCSTTSIMLILTTTVFFTTLWAPIRVHDEHSTSLSSWNALNSTSTSLTTSPYFIEDTRGLIWSSKTARERLLPPLVRLDRPRIRLEQGLLVSRVYEEDFDTPLVDSNLHHGLTPLGKDVDKLYEYFTDDLGTYLDKLESFIRTHFPSQDSDEDDPNSLINAMRSFFPLKVQKAGKPDSIPLKLFRTGRTLQSLVEGQRREWFETFLKLNPGLNVTEHDNHMADKWVRQRFNQSDERLSSGHESIVHSWNRLGRAKPVLRADLWRYPVLASDGGFYADQDVSAVRSFSQWSVPQDKSEKRPPGFTEPALIVGLEADVLDAMNWKDLFPRPIQIVQWAMGSNRGHPVMIDTIRRLHEKVSAHKDGDFNILETTGPAPWTSAVMGWLLARHGIAWPELHGMPFGGWRYQERRTDTSGESRLEFGDTRILPLTGMSPSMPRSTHPGSRHSDHPAVMANHAFAGSWRDDKQPQTWDKLLRKFKRSTMTSWRGNVQRWL